MLKPWDKQARLLALMMGSSAAMLGSNNMTGAPAVLLPVLFFTTIAARFFWPLFFHFFLVFPDPRETLSPLRRRFPRVETYLYLPHLLTLFPYSLIGTWLILFHPDQVLGWVRQYSWMGSIVIFIAVGYILAGLLSMFVNYRNATRLMRRKMRVVVAGSVSALLPMSFLLATELIAQRRQINESLMIWSAVIAVSAFLLFPFSLIYAILRHQVIPVRLILRRGVRYIFVSQTSIVLELIVVGTVLTLLLSSVFTRLHSSPLMVGIFSGLISIAVWQIARYLHQRVIAPVIDRRFFRQAYNAQQILSDLGGALRVIGEWSEETLALVCDKIQEALQAENVTIFLRRAGATDYEAVISVGHPGAFESTPPPLGDLRLPGDGLIVRKLCGSHRPLRVDFEDTQSWAAALSVAEAVDSSRRRRESAVLQMVRSALVVPVATKDELLGVISLGPRLGDLPYSSEDEHLLVAVALQIAFAFENAQLVKRRAEEERLRREVEFAAEVQRRLFPQGSPALSSLELSGVCYPAQVVGGDYYDFLLLDGGQIGIAVADVSGKGLSAALLMSTVQASLRTQASLVNGRITDLVASMNRLLCESTDMSHYATFFYAQFDELTRRLTYVNAGHNPPILVRRSLPIEALQVGRAVVERALGSVLVDHPPATSIIHQLETGGPVIGLLKDCSYDFETVEMQRGDLLIAYTDGASEAENPEGEEFGSDRLAEIAMSSSGLPVDEIRERIVAGVRAWCRDAPQHDDLTLVVVRVS
jgi:sigma-B regulation protein RsbU (phosphoserine phosphatase)